MTVAYDALLASDAPAFVVLADVQFMEPLTVWTAAGGGLTNTYYVSFSTQIATTIVPGGIYRRLDEVRQNATSLTARASSALVDANLGSYFHDTATNRLYVSTTSGAHPETWALVGAWCTLFFSTRAVSFSDQPLYLPILTGAVPTFQQELPDLLFGITVVSDTGTLGLLNGDGLFEYLAPRYVWRNKLVTFRLGGVGLAFSDFATVGSLRINGLAVGDDEATLMLESIGTVLNRSIPTRTWGDGVTAMAVNDVGEGILGESQPWLFGYAKDCALPLTSKLSNGKYQTMDLQAASGGVTVHAVYAIDRVTRARTQLVHVDHYILSGSGNLVVEIVSDIYHYDSYEIWADLQGGFTTATTCATVIKDLLLQLGVPVAQIDTSSFANADADATHAHTLGGYLTEPITAADVVRRLEQSAMVQTRIDPTGKWAARILDPSFAAWTVTDTDVLSWEPETDLTAVMNEVRVQYDVRHATGSLSEASASDDRVRYGSETFDSHTVETYLSDEWAATAEAQHLRFFTSHPGTRIRFEERGLTLMAAQVGDWVAVTRARAPVARTGAYEGQLLLLVALEKSLGPDVPSVRGVLWDLGGHADQIARCEGAAVDRTWAASTAAQRAYYGYTADANGYVDPADPVTRDGKVSW
jgi:hypothetical protein